MKPEIRDILKFKKELADLEGLKTFKVLIT